MAHYLHSSAKPAVVIDIEVLVQSLYFIRKLKLNSSGYQKHTPTGSINKLANKCVISAGKSGRSITFTFFLPPPRG